MNPAPISNITSYHAHIYYRDAAERERAAILRAQIAERFPVELGRWHDIPVGPHEQPMFQVAFPVAIFAEFVPWLMLNRLDLIIFIHPNTDNPRRDHLVHALWMGEILQIIRPERLPETMNEAPGKPA
jgi:aromatic ring-cleaving dioxygenase